MEHQSAHHAADMNLRSSGLNLSEIFVRLIKYVVEGLAVAVVAYLTLKNKSTTKEILILGVTAALIFAILDMFSPAVAAGTRQGAGFAAGASLIGFGGLPGVPMPVA